MKSGAILKALMRQKAQVQKISSESTDFPLRKGGRVGGDWENDRRQDSREAGTSGKGHGGRERCNVDTLSSNLRS